MRVLFLALLLVNVAFFAWEYRHPEPPPPSVAEVEPGVPALRLIHAPGGKAVPAAPESKPTHEAAPKPAASAPHSSSGTVQR